MDKILQEVRSIWDDGDQLEKVLITIIQEYVVQGDIYANAALSEASTFNAEMEEGFKPSVTRAEYRAKEMSGGAKLSAEKEMRALELLFEVVKNRVQFLRK